MTQLASSLRLCPRLVLDAGGGLEEAETPWVLEPLGSLATAGTEGGSVVAIKSPPDPF